MNGYIMPAQFIYKSIDWQPGLPNRYLRLQVLFFFFFNYTFYDLGTVCIKGTACYQRKSHNELALVFVFTVVCFQLPSGKSHHFKFISNKNNTYSFQMDIHLWSIKIASVRQRYLLKEKLAFIKKILL
jgi:hypothetical protein